MEGQTKVILASEEGKDFELAFPTSLQVEKRSKGL